MADKNNKNAENVAGLYYVDTACIDCDLCRTTAPDHFGHSDNGYSFVQKQPANPQETQLCAQAKSECPVDAIGDDGV